MSSLPDSSPVNSARTIALEDDYHCALVARRVFRVTIVASVLALLVTGAMIVVGASLQAAQGDNAVAALLVVFGIMFALVALGGGGWLLRGQLYERATSDGSSEFEFPGERAARLSRALARSRQADVDAWFVAQAAVDEDAS